MNLTLAEDATVIPTPGPAAPRPTSAARGRETAIRTATVNPASNVGRTIAKSTTREWHRPLLIAVSKAVMEMEILGPAAQPTSPVSLATGTVTRTVNARGDSNAAMITAEVFIQGPKPLLTAATMPETINATAATRPGTVAQPPTRVLWAKATVTGTASARLDWCAAMTTVGPSTPGLATPPTAVSKTQKGATVQTGTAALGQISAGTGRATATLTTTVGPGCGAATIIVASSIVRPLPPLTAVPTDLTMMMAPVRNVLLLFVPSYAMYFEMILNTFYLSSHFIPYSIYASVFDQVVAYLFNSKINAFINIGA